MMKKSNLSTASGITLVALVITIVVLLILAGITIMYVMGDNSIFKMASDTKTNIEQAKEEEKAYLEGLGSDIEDYIDGSYKPKIGPDKKGEIQTADKTVYKDETGTAVIPGGFCVVKDSEEDKNDINTVENGLVISDIADDDLDNSKHGNQFVWVPVKDYSKFHLIQGYANGKLYGEVKNGDSQEAGDTTEAGSPGKPNATNSTAGSSESIAMYASTKQNGGFYIARFEAGIVGTIDNYNLETKTVADGTVKPLSQKGIGVWNYIPWGGNITDKASDGLQGNDNADGVVKVARSMYKNDGVHKVTSTLCYGVQWDATLKFIEPNYGEYNEEKTDYKVASDSYVKNSTGKGNYGNITVTGSKLAYQQKHIYDMAGNIWEWTMEAYKSAGRVYRGGIRLSRWNFCTSFWTSILAG